MYKKRILSWILLPCLGLLLALTFPACSNRYKHKGYGEEAIRLAQALACHNTNLGISFTVPKGWWLYDLNTANFSPDPEDTADAAAFDYIYTGDDSFSMELMSIANLRYPERKKHLGFDISIESRKNSQEIGEFKSHYEKFIPEGEWNITLIDSGLTVINSVSFRKHVFEVSLPKNSFRIIDLTTVLETGDFLNITVRYWLKNKNAEHYILGIINRALTVQFN